MANNQIPPYPAFDEKASELSVEWEDWIEGLEAMFSLQKFTAGKEDEEKYNKLFYYLGVTRKVLKRLEKNGIAEKSYKLAKDALSAHFCPEKNSIYLLHKLYHCRQKEGESMDSFYHRVLDIMNLLEITKLKVEEIWDLLIVAQLVNCTTNDDLRRKTLRNRGKIVLKDFLDRARSDESASQELSEICGTASNVGNASALAVNKQKKKKPPQTSTPTSAKKKSGSTSNRSHSQSGKCMYCGGAPHDRQVCPARNSTCHKCQIRGHFAKVCRRNSRSVNEVVEDEFTTDDTPPEVFLGEVTTSGQAVTKKLADVVINGVVVRIRIDTGSEATLIDSEFYAQNFSSQPLKPSDCVFRGAMKGQFTALGYFNATIECGDKVISEPVYVIENVSRLLSCKASTALGLVVFTGYVYTERYPELFTGLGKLEKKYQIKLKKDAVPYAVTVPRRCSIGNHEAVGKELDRLKALGVISRVEEPTDWCAPVVIVPKPNGDVRLCVDLTKLNEAVKRPRLVLPAVDYVLGQIGEATVFSKLDANSGFHQVELDESSRLLTTFITTHGRFCFNRLPFGISSAPEFYQNQVSSIIAGIPGVLCLMDDILVPGKDEQEHDERLDLVLSKLKTAGVTLNKAKCVFRQKSISFLGHIISKEGVSPDPKKVNAVKDMEVPSDVSELRRFLGMVNHLGKFTKDLSTVIHPLRELLSTKSEWIWGPSQQEAFENVKSLLTSAPTLAFYKTNLETKVSADSSSYGLGAVLMQKHGSEWRPVAYASRSLTETEKRYAQIEKEALASTWACERFRDYLIGRSFLIETDHKPLLALLGSKDLDLLSPRVQRFRMRLMWFDYKIVHVPGKELYVADTLSRSPGEGPTEADLKFEEETVAYVNFVYKSLPASDSRIEQIRQHQWEDDVCREVAMYVRDGWPDRSQVKGIAKKYLPYQADLCIIDDLLLMGTRIVIPSSLRPEMLNKIHEGHQGIQKCRQLARESIWWPGCSTDIEELVQSCRFCRIKRINFKEPLVPSTIPDNPWQKVATDLFTLGEDVFIVVVDFYSRYPEYLKLQSTTSAGIITAMKSIFARHGIPNTVCSDNGPQYASQEFKRFAANYGFTHITSSPGHPSGNGEAERAVQTVKDLIKAPDPYIALLNYRNSPIRNGYSPAQLLMGRRLNTKIPILPSKLAMNPPMSQVVKEKEYSYKANMKDNFDQRHAARSLPSLRSGDSVYIPDRKEKAVVTGQIHERSYVVKTPTKTLVRNRVQLKQLDEVPQVPVIPGATPEIPHTPPTPKPPDASPVKSPAPVKSPQPAKQQPAPVVVNLPTAKPTAKPAKPPAPKKAVVVKPTQPAAKPVVKSPTRTRTGRAVTKPAKFQDFVT